MGVLQTLDTLLVFESAEGMPCLRIKKHSIAFFFISETFLLLFKSFVERKKKRERKKERKQVTWGSD